MAVARGVTLREAYDSGDRPVQVTVELRDIAKDFYFKDVRPARPPDPGG